MTAAGLLLLFHIKKDLENLIIVHASIWKTLFRAQVAILSIFVFHREDEAANFSAHPSSLRYSPPLKSNLKHESDTMMSNLTFEIVHLKINNRLLIANISDRQISAYVCQTDSHHSSGLHKQRLEMNGERNRFDANSNTANAIYRNSKYEQCRGEREGFSLQIHGDK